MIRLASRSPQWLPIALACCASEWAASWSRASEDSRSADAALVAPAASDGADLSLHDALAQAASTPRFGQAGSWWLSAGGGVGAGGGRANVDYNAFVGFSAFLVDDFELNLELAGWFFDQDEPDAGAANFNLAFKWHFINAGDWSLFLDSGAGVLLATEEVPPGGTNFNFTPRAGLGLTFRLGDSPNRLIIGGRWQHISNARISGDDDNPGRDTAMIYAGIVFPF